MKFMIMVKGSEQAGPPPKALMDGIAQLGIEASRAGVLVQVGGLAPTATGAKMRLSNGKLTTIDGPFTEAKEVIGGYAVYDLKSKTEAIEWTRKFMELHATHWKGWEGEAEIRQIMDTGSFDAPKPS